MTNKDLCNAGIKAKAESVVMELCLSLRNIDG